MVSQPIAVITNVSKAYLTLGSNATSPVGKPADALKFALEAMLTDSVKVIQTSPFYITSAFPKGSGPDFVNAAAEIETSLSPHDLLAFLHEIETSAGRERLKRWAQRSLDLDLISYANAVLPNVKVHEDWVNLPFEDQLTKAPDELILPHPRVQDRAFMMVPLRDVAPDWVHPNTGENVNDLIAKLPSQDVADLRKL